MKSFLSWVLLFLATGYLRAEEKTDPPVFALGEKETIVAVGDSITASGQYLLYLESYLATRFPERTFRIINSGRSSETLSNLSEVDHPGRRPCLFTRFASDVAEYEPTVVLSCYGINDGIYHPFSEERFEKFKSGIDQLEKLTRHDLKARLLVLTPPVYGSKNPGQSDVRPDETYGYKRPFADYDQVMKKYAAYLVSLKREGVTVADLHSAMAEHLIARTKESPSFRLSGDGIHPSPTGHLIMAMAVLRGWRAPALVDEARVDASKPTPISGAINDLRRHEGGLEFTWTTKLPMPSHDKWEASSVALLKLNQEFNRHRLEVKGMTGEHYRLFADDKEVGKFTRQEFEAGIDLTALENFPTTQLSRGLTPLLQQRRQLGYADFRKSTAANSGAPPERNLKRQALDDQIRQLCQTKNIRIRIAP